MLRKLACALCLILGYGVAAWAQKGTPVLEMSADGELQISPDGEVSDYRLRSELAPTVANLVERNVRSWRFEPILVDGTAVSAKTTLHLSLRAEPAGKGQYTLRVADVHFGELGPAVRMKPPRYPEEAVRAHVGGKVLLAIRVDAAGDVVEVQPYQTSLDARANSEQQAGYFRQLLERASVAAARSWHYDPKESLNGKPIGTYALVPISYSLCDMPCTSKNPKEGWRALLPGPIHDVPWMHIQQAADNLNLSALADGQARALDSRFHLKDNVIGKTL